MKLIFVVYLCVLRYELAIANSTSTKTKPPTVVTTVTPDLTTGSGIETGTSPPLIHTTKSSKLPHKKIDTKCVGWCLSKVKPNFNLNLTMNKDANERLEKKLYLTKAKIENIDAYPVRVDANIFADKELYYDRNTNPARTHVFDKNVVKIPTTIFFPITRSAVKKLMLDSGNIFLPNSDNAKPFQSNPNVPYAFLWTQPMFSNRYFESNPMLHNDMNVTSNRKTNSVVYKPHASHDPYNIGGRKSQTSFAFSNGLQISRKNSGIQVKMGKLHDFLKGYAKQRAQAKLGSSQIDAILGKPNEETILEHAHNSVNDIVAGMNIKNKNAGTFVIGATKNARSKLFSWSGQTKRAKNLVDSQDTGVVLKGKSRSKAIDSLLRSMVLNYQYGDNTPVYKKINP